MEFGFILKKTITFFVEPLGLILLLFGTGLYFLFKDKTKQAKISLSLSMGLLFLFSFMPVSNFLVENLENKYVKYQYKEDIKYIHVLGCGHTTDATQPISSQLSDASAKRVIEGIVIYRNTPGSKLIFTGYGGLSDVATASMNARFAMALGVPSEDIIISGKPKDTYEEAMFAKSIVKDDKFALVTSATHMPRAMKLFKSVGMYPLAAPTYFKQENVYDYRPDIKNLDNSRMAIHEYFGIIWASLF